MQILAKIFLYATCTLMLTPAIAATDLQGSWTNRFHYEAQNFDFDTNLTFNADGTVMLTITCAYNGESGSSSALAKYKNNNEMLTFGSFGGLEVELPSGVACGMFDIGGDHQYSVNANLLFLDIFEDDPFVRDEK